MKKLLVIGMASLFLGIGCSEKELIETSTEIEKDALILKEKTKNNREITLHQKAATVFNKILALDGVSKDLSLTVEKNAVKHSNTQFQGYVFEDHVMMRTDFVFEDDIIMLTNNSFEEKRFEVPADQVFEDHLILNVSPNIFEDNVAMLVEDFVTEDHVVLRVKTIKDDVLPSASIGIRDDILKGEKTFKNIFNSIYESLYPEDKFGLDYILDIYPNLFLSTNQSYFYSNNSSTFPLSNLSTQSTEICSGSSANSVNLTLIKDGESVLGNYYYRNNINSVVLKTSGGVTKAVYNGSGGTGNLTIDPTNKFFIYTENTSITPGSYFLQIFYSNGTTNLGGYFSISTINSPYLELFMHYETKENLNYNINNPQQYLHPLHSNPHRVTTVFHGNNEPVTFNPWLSKGVSNYSLTLTEVNTGVTETLTGLNLSGDDFAVDLRSRFNMYIGTSLSLQYIKNEYRLTMNATDCNNNSISKTITFYIDSRARLHP